MNIEIEIKPWTWHGVFMRHEGFRWVLILQEGEGPEFRGEWGVANTLNKARTKADKAARKQYQSYKDRIASENGAVRYEWIPSVPR